MYFNKNKKSEYFNRNLTQFILFFGCNFMISILLCCLYSKRINDATEFVVLIVVFVCFFIQISFYNIHKILKKECYLTLYIFYTLLFK